MIMKLNDVNYHIMIEGEGPPLLLLHGFTGSHLNWLPLVDTWKSYFRVILIDIIGHGKTESPDDSDRYTMEMVAKDLSLLIKELGYDRVNMLGYSMGGRLALSFAMLYPNQVDRLILESSSPGLKTNEEQKARRVNDAKVGERIISSLEGFVDFWEGIPLFESQKSLPESKREQLREQRLLNNQQGLVNSLVGMGTGAQPTWWDDLPSLKVPVTLIVGELDFKFCKIAEEMSHLLPHAKIDMINNVGHATHLEQSEIFGKLVVDVLTKGGQ